jgi:hypothetical protein
MKQRVSEAPPTIPRELFTKYLAVALSGCFAVQDPPNRFPTPFAVAVAVAVLRP